MLPRSLWRLRRAALLCSTFVLISAAAGAPLKAQVETPIELQEPQPAAPGFSVDSFLTLQGVGCAVRFTPGALDRAAHLLRRLELVTFQLNKWSEVPVPTAVFLVTREEWDQSGMPGTYGIPIRIGPTTLVTAAQGDAGTVALWSRLLATQQIPMVFGQPLRGTAHEAATLALADVLLQVETARGLTQRSGLLGAEAWIGELAAHVAALVVFHRHEEVRLPEIFATFDRLDAVLGAEQRGATGGFSPGLNLGATDQLDRWLWFQAKFHQGARVVLAKDGKSAVDKLNKMSKKTGSVLRREDLIDRYPELSRWLAEGFGIAESRVP